MNQAYQLGDEVWFLKNDKVASGKIRGICIQEHDKYNKLGISYKEDRILVSVRADPTRDTHDWNTQDTFYATKQELIASL